ncbi:hypothetical protein [Nocardioides alkalitolerans]|uniref:hypothetical protein n=1 Tax=Nocardioides alkalitolerans TaxID=281714 RepID=UPI00041BC887|nr:hypothetical protein [Nocardioides alkalitolerans]
MKPHPFEPRYDGSACRVIVEVVDHRPVECGKQPDEEPHDGTRHQPPDLEFPPPSCPFCWQDCDYDDGPFCEPCGVRWSSNGTAGRWDDPALPACTSSYKPHDHAALGAENERIRHFRLYCLLPHGHEAQHRSADGTVWADHQATDTAVTP